MTPLRLSWYMPVTGTGKGNIMTGLTISNASRYKHRATNSKMLTGTFTSLISMPVRNNTVVVVPASEDGSMLSERYTETMMNNILNSGKDFESFRGPFEGIPHAAIHDAVGGDM